MSFIGRLDTFQLAASLLSSGGVCVGGLGSGGSSVCMSPLRTTSLVGEVGKEVTRYKFPVKSSFWGCHIQHGTSS